MNKPHLPAYVFLYTERTQEAFFAAKQNVGSRFPIDVQNSAPPFDNKSVKAWATEAGEKLCFENGSAAAVVAFVYEDVLAHMLRVTSNTHAEANIAA